MLTTESYRGVFVIVTTPFHADLSLDLDGLDRTLAYCLDAGVDGVVATANASEGAYLTDAERRLVAEHVVKAARGRAISVVGCSATGVVPACEHARHAEAIGADAVMAMPPTFQRPTEREIKAFYEGLAGATKLPLIIQNFGGPGGTPMSARVVVDLARELPTARFVKEETEFSGVVMSEIMELGGSAVAGVMGGKGAKAIFDEHRRGACGTMPACEAADVHVALWRALEAGDTATAKRVFHVLLPLLSFELGYGPVVYKEILRRRGILGSAACRQTGSRVLDAQSHKELDAILADLASFMAERWKPDAA